MYIIVLICIYTQHSQFCQVPLFLLLRPWTFSLKSFFGCSTPLLQDALKSFFCVVLPRPQVVGWFKFTHPTLDISGNQTWQWRIPQSTIDYFPVTVTKWIYHRLFSMNLDVSSGNQTRTSITMVIFLTIHITWSYYH